MIKANRERVAYEKKLRDPDDCYLDVRHREEELRRQDQPSQIGLLLGMRKVTKEEILSGSFNDGDEDESDAEGQTDSDETEPAIDEVRS
jgi:hypothetical protein